MGIANNTDISTGPHVIKRAVFAAVVVAGLGACTPQFANHGYIPLAEDLDQITVGIDTRASVEQTIGTPSTAGVVNESGFYYVRSRKRTIGALPPKVIDRQVLAISFDSAGVVSNVERFGLERGQVVPLSRRVTTSGVGNSGFLRQILGNIGQFNPAGFGS